jgi:hypothetical protein
MAVRMQQRRATAEQWLLADPVLAEGEIGLETDTSSFKIGDGVNNWLDLDYFETSAALAGTIDDYIPLTQKEAALGVATLDETGNVPLSQLGNAPDPDLSSYATTQYVDDEIAAIPAPDFTGYATETYVNNAIDAIPEVDLTGYATETFVSTAVSSLVDSAPSTLDTLNELAAALGDDANFATTVTSAIAEKADAVHTHTVSDIADLTTTASELNILDGATVTTAELNTLGGITATVAELNHTGGVTSNIQTQLNNKKAEISEAVSSNITMVAGYRYFVNTAAARTLTLPDSPALGAEVQVFDANGSAGTNNITVNRNGQNINGITANALLDINGVAAVFVYTGATYGWRMG